MYFRCYKPEWFSRPLSVTSSSTNPSTGPAISNSWKIMYIVLKFHFRVRISKSYCKIKSNPADFWIYVANLVCTSGLTCSKRRCRTLNQIGSIVTRLSTTGQTNWDRKQKENMIMMKIYWVTGLTFAFEVTIPMMKIVSLNIYSSNYLLDPTLLEQKFFDNLQIQQTPYPSAHSPSGSPPLSSHSSLE